MDGLDLLGAGDALAGQYITVNVKNIDRDKLRAKLKSKVGNAKAQMAYSALSIVDAGPKAALDVAIPFIVTLGKQYGIDADVVVSNAPKPRRAFSEFWPGLLVGLGIGGGSLLIVKGVQRLLGR